MVDNGIEEARRDEEAARERLREAEVEAQETLEEAEELAAEEGVDTPPRKDG